MSENNRPTGVIDTVTASWRNLTLNIRLYLKFTAWTVGFGMIVWLSVLAIRYQISDGVVAKVATVAVSLPFTAVFMVLSLAMIHATWKSLSKKTVNFREAVTYGFRLLLPFVWISLLTGLLFLAIPMVISILGYSAAEAAVPLLAGHFWLYVIAAAIAAAVTAVILVTLAYYCLAIYFTANSLVIDDCRGWDCLKRTFSLIRGRWWRTLWRLGVPCLFFWLAIQFALKLAYLLVGSLIGEPGALFSVGLGNDAHTLLYSTLTMAISQVLYSLSYPLFTGTNLIVWNDLKRLEGKE